MPTTDGNNGARADARAKPRRYGGKWS